MEITLTLEQKEKYKDMPLDDIIKEVMERSKVSEREATLAKNKSMEK